jgi:hypothetical protein
MYNIFDLAESNSDALQEKYTQLIQNLGTSDSSEGNGGLSSLVQFAETVRSKGKLSINMRQTGINGMLSSGRHKNIYEVAEDERTQNPTRSLEDLLRTRIGTDIHYQARMAWDTFFDEGRRFRYSALNVGGLGTRFGEYCVVLSREFLDNCTNLAFIKQDSLFGYVLPGVSVKLKQLKKDIADSECFHKLAALKHCNELRNNPTEAEWPDIVCRDDTYIEAITIQEIHVSDDVECVYMADEDYLRKYEMVERSYFEDLSETDSASVGEFQSMKALLETQGIELRRLTKNEEGRWVIVNERD